MQTAQNLMTQTLQTMTSSAVLSLSTDQLIAKIDTYIATDDTYSTQTFMSLWSAALACFDIDSEKFSQLLAAKTRRIDKQYRAAFSKKYGLSPNVSSADIDKIRICQIEQNMCPPYCDGSFCPKLYDNDLENIITIVDGFPKFDKIACRRASAFKKSRQQKKTLANSHIPLRLQLLTFDDFIVNDDNRQAYQTAKQTVDNGKKGLYICGNCGVGKTFLAAIIANENIKQGRSVIFAAVPDLLNRIKSTFESNADELHNTTTDMLHSFKSVDLLVLDDLGMEKPTDWTVKTLTEIVNARYNNLKQTIFTSNCNSKRLEQLYAKAASQQDANRIVSRIFDMCNFVIITGTDWRRK